MLLFTLYAKSITVLIYEQKYTVFSPFSSLFSLHHLFAFLLDLVI